MKKILAIIFILALTGTALAYTGYYKTTDDNGAAVEPFSQPTGVRKSFGTAAGSFAVGFKNASSVRGPGFGLFSTSETSPGDYGLTFSDANGDSRNFSWTVEAGSATGGGATANEIRDAVLNAALASHTAAGSVGKKLYDLPGLGTTVIETMTQGKDFYIMRGDSARMQYTCGRDLTGYTFYYGAKLNPASGTFNNHSSIAVHDITSQVTDYTAGTGYMNISSVNTANLIPGKRYKVEVECRKGNEVRTPLWFWLWVVQDVIR